MKRAYNTRRLDSDLRALGTPGEAVDLLTKCLRRWSGTRHRGIPQGYTASDILGKVYFDPIDRALKDYGIDRLRYVDDLRIFCASKHEAKQAIRTLTELVHSRGLSLQSAKTDILPKPKALAKFQGIAQTIEDIAKQLKEDLGVYVDSEYESVKQVFKVLSDTSQPPPEVLECTFNEHFVTAPVKAFDKSLFHYLLYRLGAAQSTVAVPYCLTALQSRPEETASILTYLATVPVSDYDVETIIDYMESTDAMYDYQLYQLVKWFCDTRRHHVRVLSKARLCAFDQNRELWLRVYCLHYLEKTGEDVDLERVENQCQHARTDLEKASCVASLVRLEVSRRNAFLASVLSDGFLVNHAAQVVKASSQ